MKFNEFLNEQQIITEAKIIEEAARIQHAEDLIFWEGAPGASRALESLVGMTKSNHKKTSVKWDGSPAIIFGYDNNGNFTLTDKAGFYAKGYDGKPTTPEELREMFLNRKKGENREKPDTINFANKMADVFYIFKAALPSRYKGYFKGDLLYFSKPTIVNNHYTFQPNVVKYDVEANSEIGKRIGQSEVGVVIHRSVDSEGVEHPLKDMSVFKGKDLFAIPPVFAEQKATINDDLVKQVKSLINKNHLTINNLLDTNTLKQKQLSDFPDILYRYLNGKVDTGLNALGSDFFDWLNTLPRLSSRKRNNITEHINENREAFNNLWQIVSNIMAIKDDIIYQFENNLSAVKPSMAGEAGGEGFVYADKQGDIKLVPRSTFSRINRSVQR